MKLIFSFGLVFLYSLTFAQTAKDYFFPASDKNVSVFRMPEIKGMPGNDSETQVYFKDGGDSTKVTTLYFREGKLSECIEQAVKIGEEQISIGREKIERKKTIEVFNSGKLIFKMPPKKGIVEWGSEKQHGSVLWICAAEFSRIKIDGKRKKAIKVTTSSKRKHDGKIEAFYIDYYVEGIGHYKRTTPGKEIVLSILTNQKYDPNPPSHKITDRSEMIQN